MSLDPQLGTKTFDVLTESVFLQLEGFNEPLFESQMGHLGLEFVNQALAGCQARQQTRDLGVVLNLHTRERGGEDEVEEERTVKRRVTQ